MHSIWSASFYSCLVGFEYRFPKLYDIVLQIKDEYDSFDEKYAKQAKQKDLCAEADEELFKSFLSSFHANEKQSKALFLSAATHGTSQFLNSRYSEVSAFIGLNQFDFSEGLRRRLLMSPTREGSRLTCQCHSAPTESDKFHVFRCKKFQYYWEKRHDMIRDELYHLIKIARPSAFVHKEQNVTRYRNPSSTHHQTDLRCDIMVTDNLEQYIIDVSVIDPTTICAINKGSHSKPFIAAGIREKEKRQDYGRYLSSDMLEKFVPFVLESTGRFGHSASSFIDKICKLDKLDLAYDDAIRSARWRFLQSVSNILVITSAQVARLSRYGEAAA